MMGDNTKWTPILSEPERGSAPYDWSSKYVGECTWGGYYRVQKNGWTPPCYFDRPTKTAGFTTAKDWLDNYREPWVPIFISSNPNYSPVPGDILVFDGNYGHIAVIEQMKIPGELYVISDWNRVSPGKFDICDWKKGYSLTKTGSLVGYLHYEPSIGTYVTPVERNTEVPQILAYDSALRVRNAPNLNGEICCYILPGYYNVLSKTAANATDISKTPGLSSWYEIEKGKYCANITTEYFPGTSRSDISDIFRQLEDAYMDIYNENSKYKLRIDRAIKVLSGEDDI